LGGGSCPKEGFIRDVLHGISRPYSSCRGSRAYRAGVRSIEGLATADLVDAMGQFHRHRCHILDLVSPTPGRVLFGPAVTISYFPSCSAALDPERYNFAKLFYQAVGDEPEAKVVVLASNGYADSSMGGGTKLSRLQVHGCAGVITDGRAVVIPDGQVEDVLAGARAVKDEDAGFREQIATERLGGTAGEAGSGGAMTIEGKTK
jgi:regulator of RNase E activity RraA